MYARLSVPMTGSDPYGLYLYAFWMAEEAWNVHNVPLKDRSEHARRKITDTIAGLTTRGVHVTADILFYAMNPAKPAIDSAVLDVLLGRTDRRIIRAVRSMIITGDTIRVEVPIEYPDPTRDDAERRSILLAGSDIGDFLHQLDAYQQQRIEYAQIKPVCERQLLIPDVMRNVLSFLGKDRKKSIKKKSKKSTKKKSKKSTKKKSKKSTKKKVCRY
jgi:hypothetical protein